MSEVRFVVDAEDAIRAFLQAPQVMRRHLEEGLDEGSQLIARVAMAKAPKFHSALVNSIRNQRVGDLVWEAATEVTYARAVEEGVKGPMARAPGFEHGLMEWIKDKLRPESDAAARSIAFAVGQSMKRKGIKAQPYMAPAAERADARVRAILAGAVEKGVREVFGG